MTQQRANLINKDSFFAHSEKLFMMANLNWLLHKMYLMGDFAFCKQIIDIQMPQQINQEYLFYIKVSNLMRYVAMGD